jgi:hypothetical protein
MRVIAYITKDRIVEGEVFFVRFYDSVKDIVLCKRPLDVYECKDVIIDKDTATYLSSVTDVENDTYEKGSE